MQAMFGSIEKPEANYGRENIAKQGKRQKVKGKRQKAKF
jgi:hypothetical protein